MRPPGERPPGERHGHGGPHGHHGALGGGRVRRGEVRDILLAALLEGPAHGYELMDRLEQRSFGRWRPSPGSVYPLLQLFEDQSLVEAQTVDGRKVFQLTEAGRAQADQSRLRQLTADPSAGMEHMQLRAEVQQLHAAARQVATAGTSGQVEQAATIVRGARQALYRLLAEQ